MKMGQQMNVGILYWFIGSSLGFAAKPRVGGGPSCGPPVANSMMVDFAGDQVLKFYNSHLLELTWQFW